MTNIMQNYCRGKSPIIFHHINPQYIALLWQLQLIWGEKLSANVIIKYNVCVPTIQLKICTHIDVSLFLSYCPDLSQQRRNAGLLHVTTHWNQINEKFVCKCYGHKFLKVFLKIVCSTVTPEWDIYLLDHISISVHCWWNAKEIEFHH